MAAMIQNQYALALPFINLSYKEIQKEFQSDKQEIIEKYSNSSFFKDMVEYVKTFTSENYLCNYYEINSFNSKHSNTENIFPKICHLNIRSLNLHKHELAAYLDCLNCTFDIILLTKCGHALKASIEEI